METKYKILINYLKDLLEENDDYVKLVTKEDIRRILKALEELK